MKCTLVLATPERHISDMAKVCYNTKTDKDITKSLVGDKGHLAVLRFAYMTIHVEGVSVACHSQMLRSKHLDFLVESKRYVSLDKGGFEFIMPELMTPEVRQLMNNHWYNTLKLYRDLLDMGVKKEDARAILPANTSTKLNVTGNLQSWYDAFKLRLSPHAQTEIRNVYKEIYKIAKEEYPQVFTEELFKKLIEGH